MLLVLLAIIIFGVPYLDGVLIQGVQSNIGGGILYTPGPLFNAYGALLFVLITTLISILTIAERKAVGKERGQLRLVLSGTFIFALVSVVVNVVLPAFGVNPVVAYDAQSSLFWVALTAYAITRHGLFDIKVLATQSFIVLLLLLVLSRIFAARNVSDIVFESVVFAFTAIIGYFLSSSVRNEVSRREEVEQLAREKTEAYGQLEQRNKNLATLQQISSIVLNESDMKEMAQKILDSLPQQLESCAGALLSIVREGSLAAYAMSQSPFTQKIHSLIGDDLEQYTHRITAGFNLMHDAVIKKAVQDSDSLSDFVSPPLPKTIAFTVQKLIGAQHIEAIPLIAGGEPFGVMMYVFTADRNSIHAKNFEIAKSISDEMSLAIQRAQAFQKLKDANEYLAQLDKMKDEFISMASHELNTPLAAIEGYLSMILDEHMGGKIDAKTKEYLSRAYASSKRLAELILDLLNVSRIEQGRLKMKFSKVSLVDLAESVIHELQIKADAKKIYLKVEADKKKVPLTWCDPDRIREVFVNLAGNAIKFTEKGGVTIKIDSPDGQTIRSAVTDTGRGIAAEDQKKLFQKFSQVKREVDEHQGTGLGLYISKNFVDLHKGRLWVQSEAGKGATFLFELPINKEAPKAVEGAILENPIGAPVIEQDKGKIPSVITESSKVR